MTTSQPFNSINAEIDVATMEVFLSLDEFWATSELKSGWTS